MLFGTTPPDEVEVDPQSFFAGLHLVQVPGDTLFVTSFRSVWHSFRPTKPDKKALFAVSVHTDEYFGLTDAEKKNVLEVGASIPLLTRPAPDKVVALLREKHGIDKCEQVVLSW